MSISLILVLCLLVSIGIIIGRLYFFTEKNQPSDELSEKADELNTKVRLTIIAFSLLLGLQVINFFILLSGNYFALQSSLAFNGSPALFSFSFFGFIVPAVGLLLTFLIIKKGIQGAVYGFIPIQIFYFITSLQLFFFTISRGSYLSFWITMIPWISMIVYFSIMGLLFYGTATPVLEALRKIRESKYKESEELSDKEFLPALILCLFIGILGIHRFYAGKVGTGILMILTLGGLGIWVLVDFIMICFGSFRDIDGRIIKYQRAVYAATDSNHSEVGKAEELEKFAELKEKGVISEEEFNKKKEELLK
ncbi:uncharacterized protein METZ01_LOCUS317392 [marine metagenome]|uniref:TM2 domain-containing protein n=1 Tax=marine metagenome TaxID=408172 RepID=A0A382NVL3_9ZZZZ